MKLMTEKRAMLVCLIFALLVPEAASAVDASQNHAADEKNTVFDVSIGTELMSGDTTYGIGGPVTYADGKPAGQGLQHFPFSELEWPLNIWLARIDATMHVGSSWRINAKLKKNISDPHDHMLDSDWVIPGSLDVYSESNISDFDAMVWDVDVEWAFLQGQSWELYAGAGYQYQDFSYDSRLIMQYSPSGLFPELNLYGNGRNTVAYDISYAMVYFVVGTAFSVTPEFSIAGSFSYSPVVEAEDEDAHLATYKTSTGNMEGDAIMVNVSGTYALKTPWFLEAGINYTAIDVDGDQQQFSHGVNTYTVHEESESRQTSAYLTLGCRF